MSFEEYRHLIVCFVLAYTATEEVKGFAITLGIGVVATMFSSLFISRIIYAWLIDRFGVSQMRQLPMLVPFLQKSFEPNINWIKLRPLFILISAGLIGLAVFDAPMAAGIARISIAAVATIGFVLILHLATHGYERAVMLIPTWFLLLVWVTAAGFTVVGQVTRDLVPPSLIGGLVLIGIALLSVVDIVPEEIAQFAPFALLALFPGAWLVGNRRNCNPFKRSKA